MTTYKLVCRDCKKEYPESGEGLREGVNPSGGPLMLCPCGGVVDFALNTCQHNAVQILDGLHRLDRCDDCEKLILYRVNGATVTELWSGDADALAELVAEKGRMAQILRDVLRGVLEQGEGLGE